MIVMTCEPKWSLTRKLCTQRTWMMSSVLHREQLRKQQSSPLPLFHLPFLLLFLFFLLFLFLYTLPVTTKHLHLGII